MAAKLPSVLSARMAMRLNSFSLQKKFSMRWRPWEQHEAHEIAERVRKGKDLGAQAAFGAADGLALSPPFAPWPWRWTLMIVPSTIANSRSGSSEQASNRR